jgi:tetratricopeptide (TPR) repeat protein
MLAFRVLCVCVLSILCGCAGIAPDAKLDTQSKLREAVDLYANQDRPLVADRLIREATETYLNSGDQLGLAEAYRTYGFFLRSQSVEGKSKYYRENGFLDRSVSFDTRYEKSIDYLEKARAIFERYGRFDALTNVNLNIGFTYEVLGNLDAACRAFDRSVGNNRDSLESAKVKVALPKGVATYEDFLAPHRKRAGCETPRKRPGKQRSVMSA